jgi:hypothetical protein
MALRKDDLLDFYNGKIRVINLEGEILSEFTAQDHM